MRWGRGTRRGLPRVLPWWAAAILGLLLVVAGATVGRRPPPRSDGVISGPARIIDGDTLIIRRTRIRLYAIDAPETQQTCSRESRAWACGISAREYLYRAAAGKSLTCRFHGRDRYRRALAVCEAAGRDLNAALVSAGLAVRYGRSGLYGREEREARAARRGMWAGKFQSPQEWRREHPAS